MGHITNSAGKIRRTAENLETIRLAIEHQIEGAQLQLDKLKGCKVDNAIARAKAYWIAVIMGNLGNKDYGEGSMYNMDDTIEELRQAAQEEAWLEAKKGEDKKHAKKKVGSVQSKRVRREPA